MTFYVMSSRGHVREEMGWACPLSPTDPSQPSLNGRMVWSRANLILSYFIMGCTALCDCDVDISPILKEKKTEKGGREGGRRKEKRKLKS